MPTLVITGDHDFITGPACGAEVDRGSPTLRGRAAGARHMIFVEAREPFRDAVLSFLGVGAPA